MEIVGFQIHLVFSQIDYMTEKNTPKNRAQGRIVGALEPPTVQPEAPWASLGDWEIIRGGKFNLGDG